ncbi:MAG: LysM peptidoglycan-binding domain-containing protein [Lysobacterales bacterium]
MGFMAKFSKILGADKAAVADTVKGPSATLREHGIDPSNLKFSFNQDGTVGVSGHVNDQSECDRICQVIKEIPNVSGVKNNLVVGDPEPVAEPEVVIAETASTGTASAAEESGDQGRTYTVEAGDTLWAIAAKMYGNGGRYMKIYEANSVTLENPDKIFPGQKLVIPDIEES